jgi:parvulin-like peptidyl-prolyl isomerase
VNTRVAICLSGILVVVLVSCGQDPGLKNKMNALKVNDTWITKAEIDQLSGQMNQQLAMLQPDMALSASTVELRKTASRQLVARQLLMEEAKRLNITFKDSAVQLAFAEFKKQVGQDRFIQGLAAAGKTQEDFKKELPSAMAVDSIVKKILAKVDTVTPGDCKEFYTKNTDKFSVAGKIKARQILFLIKKDASAQVKDAAKKKAEDVLAQIKAGKDFAAMAKTYSQDPGTAKDGGNIGWFQRGDFALKELEDAAFALKKDEIGPVIQSQLGFHIVQKTDEEAPKTMAFDQAKDKIKMMLEMKNRTEAIQAYVDGLIAKAKIVYADTSYKPAPAGGMSSAFGLQ